MQFAIFACELRANNANYMQTVYRKTQIYPDKNPRIPKTSQREAYLNLKNENERKTYTQTQKTFTQWH